MTFFNGMDAYSGTLSAEVLGGPASGRRFCREAAAAASLVQGSFEGFVLFVVIYTTIQRIPCQRRAWRRAAKDNHIKKGLKMYAPFSATTSAASAGRCPVRSAAPVAWWQGLPSPVRALVVAPTHFEVRQDYEIAADRTQGYGADRQPRFCAFRYVLTQLRSDDDEVFYEAPVYAETVTSWRLLDDRWLVSRTTIGNLDRGEFQTRLSLSDTMPR